MSETPPNESAPTQVVAKYSWNPASYHKTKRQRDWLNLATALFNIDTHDMLLSESQKKLALSYLARELSPSEKKKTFLICNNAIVRSARYMCEGKKVFDELHLCTALLRYQLDPPQKWLEWDVARECLDVLMYLKNCLDGIEEYSAQGMADSMPYDGDYSWESDEGEDDCDVGAASLDNASARPRRSRKSFFITPLQPSKANGISDSVDEPSIASGPSLKTGRASRKRAASQPLGSREKITRKNKNIKVHFEAFSSSENNADDWDCIDEEHHPSWATQTARFRPAHREKDSISLQSPKEHTIDKLAQTANILDKIALYESAVARKIMLVDFIADIESMGWIDHSEVVKQLAKDEDEDSRKMLAKKAMEFLLPRIQKPKTEASLGDIPRRSSRLNN